MSDTPAGALPQSNALAEATPTSVAELMSKSPPYTPEDRKRIVAELREQRARWVKAEAAGEHTRAKKAPQSFVTTKTLGGMGL